MVKSPNSQRDFCFWNAIMVSFPWTTCICAFSLALSRSNIHKSILEGWVFLVDSVSINPVLSTIKLLRWFIVCQEEDVMPDVAWEFHLSELYRPVRRRLIESIYWKLPRLWYLAWWKWPLKDGNEIDSILPSFYFFVEIGHDPKLEQIFQIHLDNNKLAIAVAFNW